MIHPTSKYPKEQWWIAAYGHEVSREILGRTFLDERVVLYRTEAGKAVAMEGYCPHRNYPFEKGQLQGDSLCCGYHGFEFDCSGKCVNIPSQDTIPAKTRVKAFPLEEKGGLIWIWMGDPEKADPKKLPDVEKIGLGASGWKAEVSPVAHLDGRYSLLIDNLMDLTHVAFIHAETIPAGDALARISSEVKVSDYSVKVERLGKNIPSNPFFRLMFSDYDGPVDQYFNTEYVGPCLIHTGGPLLASGTGKKLGTIHFIHGITPKTEFTSHYYVVTDRDFGLDDAKIGEYFLTSGDAIQPQDIDVIGAIEAGFQSRSRYGMPKEVSSIADAGGIRVRRSLQAQIEAE